MKITKQKLIIIIKEELDAALAESKSPMPIEGLTDADWVLWQRYFDEAVDAQRSEGLDVDVEKASDNSEGLDVDVEKASDHANKKIIARRNAEASGALPTNEGLDEGDPSDLEDDYNKGYLDCYFDLNEPVARETYDDARKEVGEGKMDAEVRKRAVELLKPSKGGLGPDDDDGIDF